MTETPLQTLIDELEAKLKEFENNPMTKITAKNAIKFAITRAKQLLEVEKEMIEKAYESEISVGKRLMNPSMTDAQIYYKEQFKNI